MTDDLPCASAAGTWLAVLLVAACSVALGGCNRGTDAALPEAYLRLDMDDQSGAEQLVRYYFGGYIRPEAKDPFAEGLVVKKEGHFYVNTDTLRRFYPAIASKLKQAGGQEAIGWEKLLGFLQATYYQARDLPPTLAELREKAPYQQEGEKWFTVEIDGVMTSARRRVHVRRSALRSALRGYHRRDEQLIYPVGTTIIGDHYRSGERVETTAMQKRPDGYWDFFTYNEAGQLARRTQTPPRALKTPTQCAGCHFGTKLFDPEKSFPAPARPGPRGPRTLHVGDSMRDAEVTQFFKEHSKRSDMVLGLYNTLFVSWLRTQRQAGELAAQDRALLDTLGL